MSVLNPAKILVKDSSSSGIWTGSISPSSNAAPFLPRVPNLKFIQVAKVQTESHRQGKGIILRQQLSFYFDGIS